MTHNNAVYQSLKRIILEILPDVDPDNISLDRRLVDLGANSIDRAEIAIRTMEELSIKLPLIELAKVANIGELVGVLSKHADSK